MKKILSLLFIITINNCLFAQNQDTNVSIAIPYKNNVQAGVFAPSGIFTLQYEHALTEKISINGICTFNYPYLTSTYRKDYSIEWMPQVRWYIQKKKRCNQGLYISVSTNFVMQQSYTYGSYNPQTSDIRLNSNYLPSGYYYEKNIAKQKMGIYTGVGVGYQWLVAQRMIIDIGYSIQYLIFQRERFENIPVQNQWQKVGTSDLIGNLYYPFQMNVGYAF